MSDSEWVECPHCNGTKMEFPDCEECEGRGWVDDPGDGGTMMCPECNGESCSVCDGEGLVAAEHSVQADGLCSNCGRDYFENETIVDGELRCSCARRQRKPFGGHFAKERYD